MQYSNVDLTELQTLRKHVLPFSVIYGCQVGSVDVIDHALFPNPRHEVNRDIVESIKDGFHYNPNGANPVDGWTKLPYADPITIYPYAVPDITGGKHNIIEYIVLDGKTRLTATAELIEENDYEDFDVPISPFFGTYLEARIEQLKRNVPEAKSSLSEIEVALYVKGLLDDGADEEVIKTLMGWTGKRGTRAYNKYSTVIHGEPEIFDKFVNGEITLNDARAVEIAEDLSVAEKIEAAGTIATAKKEGKSTVEARDAANIARDRTSTMTKAEIFDYLADIYEEVKPHIKEEFESKIRDYVPLLKTEDDIYRHVDKVNILAIYETLCKVMKIEGTEKERMELIESRMSVDQLRNVMVWIHP